MRRWATRLDIRNPEAELERKVVSRAQRKCPSDAEIGVAAPESGEGGCPNWGHNEDGDDGDAHNGSIHVLMCFARGSSSCMCVTAALVQSPTQHLPMARILRLSRHEYSHLNLTCDIVTHFFWKPLVLLVSVGKLV